MRRRRYFGVYTDKVRKSPPGGHFWSSTINMFVGTKGKKKVHSNRTVSHHHKLKSRHHHNPVEMGESISLTLSTAMNIHGKGGFVSSNQ